MDKWFFEVYINGLEVSPYFWLYGQRNSIEHDDVSDLLRISFEGSDIIAMNQTKMSYGGDNIGWRITPFSTDKQAHVSIDFFDYKQFLAYFAGINKNESADYSEIINMIDKGTSFFKEWIHQATERNEQQEIETKKLEEELSENDNIQDVSGEIEKQQAEEERQKSKKAKESFRNAIQNPTATKTTKKTKNNKKKPADDAPSLFQL